MNLGCGNHEGFTTDCPHCRDTAKKHVQERMGLTGIPIAFVSFDPSSELEGKFKVRLTDIACNALAGLSDLELKVFAYDAGKALQSALEMPPSPKGER